MRRALYALALILPVCFAQSQTDSRLWEGMRWRQIGPFRGGRSCAVSGVVGRPNEFYGGFTGGGVWKSSDSGKNWNCVSDGFFKTGSVGAIAVSESSPDTVVVGMGETEIRGNISPGDGVYRSDDGGKTWRHLGLENTRFISRVRIHPKNPNIIWVAALGHVYGPSEERGVYLSTDGGQNWTRTLYVDDRSGAEDLCIDPSNPDILYASTWTCWRTPYSLSSGGLGSKLWKSTDGGRTWASLTAKPGIPDGVLGKICVAVSPADPKRVYAMIEAEKGGLYVSNDAGESWTLATSNRNLRQRPWYYSRVYADPKNADRVVVLNVAYGVSTNGGKNFSQSVAEHSDHHDCWIDPSDTKRMVMGNDGGVTVTTDGGQTWSDQDQPTAQFYHVTTDNGIPYRILGAQQDNSTVRILSRAPGRGIGTAHWTSTAGGESGFVAAKPDDPDVVFGGSYGGDLSMQNHRTGESRAVDPWPDNPMGDGAINSRERFQWTFPIVFSPHKPYRLYTCSQHVMASDDLGGSWKRISPDLTRNDPKTLGSSGGPLTQDNTGVEVYGTVFSFAESAVKRGLLWAGSDDGLVHVSRNGGRSWTNVTPVQMPDWGLVSSVEPSWHDPAVMYLAVDNHENDDHAPYAFRTGDYGKTWVRITDGLPSDQFVRVVREDPEVKGLLYAGTEFGMYVSFDAGGRWQPLQLNLPIVPIHDLTVKNGDLIAATHGRSFWVLDDLSPIRQAAGASADKNVLFAPRPAGPTLQGGGFGRGSGTSDEPLGENFMTGLVVSWYIAKDAESAKLELVDRDGVVVSSRPADAKTGLHRSSLNPSYPGWQGFPGLLFWAAGASPIAAPPGAYTVRLTVGKEVLTAPATWTVPAGSGASAADLVERYRLSQQISERVTAANKTVLRIRALRTAILTACGDSADAKKAAEPLLADITAAEEAIYQTKAEAGQDLLNFPIRLNNKLAALLGVVQSGWFRPTRQSYEVFDDLNGKLTKVLGKLDSDLQTRLPVLNKDLVKLGRPEVKISEKG